jgi:hypothetical protein
MTQLAPGAPKGPYIFTDPKRIREIKAKFPGPGLPQALLGAMNTNPSESRPLGFWAYSTQTPEPELDLACGQASSVTLQGATFWL